MSRAIYLANPYGFGRSAVARSPADGDQGESCEGDGCCGEEPNDRAIRRGPRSHVRTSRSWWYGHRPPRNLSLAEELQIVMRILQRSGAGTEPGGEQVIVGVLVCVDEIRLPCFKRKAAVPGTQRRGHHDEGLSDRPFPDSRDLECENRREARWGVAVYGYQVSREDGSRLLEGRRRRRRRAAATRQSSLGGHGVREGEERNYDGEAQQPGRHTHRIARRHVGRSLY